LGANPNPKWIRYAYCDKMKYLSILIKTKISCLAVNNGQKLGFKNLLDSSKTLLFINFTMQRIFGSKISGTNCVLHWLMAILIVLYSQLLQITERMLCSSVYSQNNDDFTAKYLNCKKLKWKCEQILLDSIWSTKTQNFHSVHRIRLVFIIIEIIFYFI
jgi:hypothetical protein